MFVCMYWLFRATGPAYGSSQAQGRIKLQLPAYATATAPLDLSSICNLHHSSQQCGIRAASATYTTAHGNARSLTR